MVFKMTDVKKEHTCVGQSEDYKVIHQSGFNSYTKQSFEEWLVLDVGGDHVIPIDYCPYCGKKL